jgi:hypothetical protein
MDAASRALQAAAGKQPSDFMRSRRGSTRPVVSVGPGNIKVRSGHYQNLA